LAPLLALLLLLLPPPLPQAAEAAEVQRIMDGLAAVAKGDKKPTDGEMFKSYNPKMVEAAWYDW
jgi:hypothetical protein